MFRCGGRRRLRRGDEKCSMRARVWLLSATSLTPIPCPRNFLNHSGGVSRRFTELPPTPRFACVTSRPNVLHVVATWRRSPKTYPHVRAERREHRRVPCSTTGTSQNAARSSLLSTARTYPQPLPMLPLQPSPRPSTPDQIERPPPCPPPRLLTILLNLRSLYPSVTAPLLHFRSIVDTLPKRLAASSVLDHLVVVPGHAI